MRKQYIAVLVLAVAVLAVGFYLGRSTIGIQQTTTTAGLRAVMYTTPTCGCCHNYARYLEENGVNVEIVYVSDRELLRKLGVAPKELRSCHILEFNGYYVIGHVPLEAVQKLFAEKPDVKGIALPGMPPGSPGMGGKKQGVLTIYYFSEREVGIFMKV